MKHLLSLLIIIYGMNGCGFCDAQQVEMRRLNIPYKYIVGDTRYTMFPTIVNDYGVVHQGLITGGELFAFLNQKAPVA